MFVFPLIQVTVQLLALLNLAAAYPGPRSWTAPVAPKVAYVTHDGVVHYEDEPPVKRSLPLPICLPGLISPILSLLESHSDGLEFCLELLHGPKTVTQTRTQPITEVSTSTKVDVETARPATSTLSVTATTTTTTHTETTETLTFTSVSTTTSYTSTTYLHSVNYDAPNLHRRINIPDYLLNCRDQDIEAACRQIVDSNAKTIYTTVHPTSHVTVTTGTTTTTTPPPTIVTQTVATDTLTITDPDIVTISTSLTESSVSTVVPTGPLTQCSNWRPVYAVLFNQQHPEYFTNTGEASPDACCQRCWDTKGCALWTFWGGGCYLSGRDSGTDPQATEMCPNGYGDYGLLQDSSDSTVFGAPGPCIGHVTWD